MDAPAMPVARLVPHVQQGAHHRAGVEPDLGHREWHRGLGLGMDVYLAAAQHHALRRQFDVGQLAAAAALAAVVLRWERHLIACCAADPFEKRGLPGVPATEAGFFDLGSCLVRVHVFSSTYLPYGR
ncbi:hypothetical protein D3C72_2091700 [compost metagenome]